MNKSYFKSIIAQHGEGIEPMKEINQVPAVAKYWQLPQGAIVEFVERQAQQGEGIKPMQTPGEGAEGKPVARDWQRWLPGGPSPEYTGPITEMPVEPPEVLEMQYPGDGGAALRGYEQSLQQGYGLTQGVPVGEGIPSGQGAPIGQVYPTAPTTAPQWSGPSDVPGRGPFGTGF